MNDLNLSEFRRGQIWPILPAEFEGMFRQLQKSQEIDGIKAIARQTQSQQSEYYDIDDGVAVISVSGPIMKRASFFSFLFGATSYAFIRRAVREATEDDAVGSIVLRVDSPGGVVNGVEETGDLIFNARQKKPIVAYADGLMASAAYWLGSAAETIIAGKTASVGSIGVLMVHEDWSRYNENAGINVSYLTAGKYKALGNPDEPLSDLARETFQAELNTIYSIFVDTVARNRDAETSDVLSNMADGRVFIGQQAQDAGLIDDILTYEKAVELARSMADDGRQYNPRRINAMPNEIKIESVEQLRVEFPELVKQIEAAAVKGVDIEAATTTASKTERDRILGLAEVQFGEEKGAKFRAVVESGTTVDSFKAIMAATGASTKEADESNTEAATIQAKADALKAAQAAGPEDPGTDTSGQAGGVGYMQQVADYQRENKCNKFEAMQAVNRIDPEARAKYVKASQVG